MNRILDELLADFFFRFSARGQFWIESTWTPSSASCRRISLNPLYSVWWYVHELFLGWENWLKWDFWWKMQPYPLILLVVRISVDVKGLLTKSYKLWILFFQATLIGFSNIFTEFQRKIQEVEFRDQLKDIDCIIKIRNCSLIPQKGMCISEWSGVDRDHYRTL